MEYLTGLADAITVSSSFLMRRYGGVMVPHGRDTDFLDPARYNIEAIRQELCLDKRKNIVFLGTPGPLKGLEDLIMAIRQLDRPEVRVLLVGAQEQSPFVQRLISLGGSSLEVRGYCPLEDIPRYLVAADLIVLPQRFASKNVAQVPAKLFDAMAMARPIISTAISDIPEILQDCGVVVPPGDVETLARQIARLLDHPEEAQELGLRAREKCIRNYSWNVMEETLANVLDQYE
jgi:glycosyltransferase involved in cell wall biosynthesis